MTFSPFRKDRHVVPRWRSVKKTIALGELAMPRKGAVAKNSSLSHELKRRLEAWRREPTLVSASEVVETSLVEGLEGEGVRPARILATPDSGATPLLRRQAALLLRRAGHGAEIDDEVTYQEVSAIARARNRTRLFPREPYAWTDLALAYLIHGKKQSAHRAITVGLQLAPNDRHVLRSAARFFLHLNDNEHAHDLLKKNPATRNDPWLMAGEIALSALADRNPGFFKAGNSFLDGAGFHPKQTSELASAIGTVHLREGNRKARRLFTASLLDPTGNALAQAEWASPRIGNLVRPQALEQVEDSAEARTFQAYWNKNFPQTIKECAAWHLDEPYSSRPHIFGSAVAIVIEDFETALRWAEDGIKINPKEPALHNNRAFALVASGRFDEAMKTLSHCLAEFPEENVGPLIATAGMYAMRTGQFEQAKKQYREAINHFKRTGHVAFEAMAFAYFSQEAARAGLPEARNILQEAKDAYKKAKLIPEAEIILKRAEGWLQLGVLQQQTGLSVESEHGAQAEAITIGSGYLGKWARLTVKVVALAISTLSQAQQP
jgi:tetratricopeptide (TPR) repeat protein